MEQNLGKHMYKSTRNASGKDALLTTLLLIIPVFLVIPCCIIMLISPNVWGLFNEFFISRLVSIAIIVVCLVVALIYSSKEATPKPIHVEIYENGLIIEIKSEEETKSSQFHFADIIGISYVPDIVIYSKTAGEIILDPASTEDFTNVSFQLKSVHTRYLVRDLEKENIEDVTLQFSHDVRFSSGIFTDGEIEIPLYNKLKLSTNSDGSALLIGRVGCEETKLEIPKAMNVDLLQHIVNTQYKYSRFGGLPNYLASKRVKEFEAVHQISKERERYLAFCAVFCVANSQ